MRRFQNASFVAQQIAALHSVPRKYIADVRKQAEQIRYCLIQANEYFRAAEAVSLATKPLLVYYGVMSLALAEILFKQDGRSSLDVARGQNAHHGLTLRLNGKPNKQLRLEDSAAALCARPLIRENGERFGTFELWHRSSREAPICGPLKIHLKGGGTNDRVSVFAVSTDERPERVPDAGISLLDCFRALPSMSLFIQQCGAGTDLVRVRTRAVLNADETSQWTIVVQPTATVLLDEFLPRLLFKDYSPSQIHIRDMPGGLGILIDSSPTNPGPQLRMPNAIQLNEDEVFFCVQNQCLNEFGLYYVGMYILGNYARYFPEQWMRDVEDSSDLATAAETFISCCESRAPTLLLSELSQHYFLLP